MKQMPGRSIAAPMIAVSLATRMFWGLSIDFHYALNALWMCPLVGLALFAPLALAVDQSARLGNGSPLDNLSRTPPRPLVWALEGLFALMLLWDAAATVRLTASSSNVIALSNITVQVLSLPLVLAAFFIVLMGIEAEGLSARIWLKLLPVLFLVVLLVQLKSYNIGWLAPILGDGVESILSGGVYCAGCMALLTLPWLIAVPDRNSHGLFRYAALPALATALLLATQQMLYPVLINSIFTRAARIELVLANGRIMLSPQLVVNVLWYGCLLHQIAAEVTAASAYLTRIAPKAPLWVWAALTALVVLILPAWNPPPLIAYLQWAGLMFIIIGGMLSLLLLVTLVGKEGRSACKKSN